MQPAGASHPVDSQKKRRRNREVDRDSFATWTPATDAHHDSRRGYIGSSREWHAVTAEERDRITRRKEKMYVRGEHNCWLHCDAPSECRLAVCTACVEGRARLVGRGKLSAVLLEDNLKKNKNKNKKKTKTPAATISVGSDDENGESEPEGERECVILRTFRRKKAQILNSERRPSTEITTEHVENLQDTAKDGDEKGGSEGEERTTSIPRHVSWPSSMDLKESSNKNKHSEFNPTGPKGILATLINGSDPETQTGCLPFEPSHDEEELEEAEDVDFSELVRISSNLSQNTGSISTGTSSSAVLVSPLETDVNIISIHDADGIHSSATETGTSAAGGYMFTTQIHQPAGHAQGFVDLKDLETGYLSDPSSKGNKKRQRDDLQEKQNTRSSNIFSPSPMISFKVPAWRDFDDDNRSLPATVTATSGRFENSASDLMDILSSSAPSLGTLTASVSVVTSNKTRRKCISSPPLSSLPSPPLSPDSPDNFIIPTIDHDLSIYIDDEIISPVSIAARNLSVSTCSTETTPGTETSDDTSCKYEDGDDQHEVLLALRKMQSAFMGGRAHGRLW